MPNNTSPGIYIDENFNFYRKDSEGNPAPYTSEAGITWSFIFPLNYYDSNTSFYMNNYSSYSPPISNYTPLEETTFWDVEVVPQQVQNGIDLAITLTNKGTETVWVNQFPYWIVKLPFMANGLDVKYNNITGKGGTGPRPKNYWIQPSAQNDPIMNPTGSGYLTNGSIFSKVYPTGGKSTTNAGAPCFAFDTGTTGTSGSIPVDKQITVGFSTNFPGIFRYEFIDWYGGPYANGITGTINADYNFQIVPFYAGNPTVSQSVVPDGHMLKPGESLGFSAWFRAVNALGATAVLQTWQPLIDNIKQTKTATKFESGYTGRINGLSFSTTSTDNWLYFEIPPTENSKLLNPRRYWQSNVLNSDPRRTSNGEPFRPDTVSGWKEFLDLYVQTWGYPPGGSYSGVTGVSASVAFLKDLGYNGLMFWALSGGVREQQSDSDNPMWQGRYDFADVYNYFPDWFNTLPQNLAATLDEAKTWQEQHNMKVFVYTGYGLQLFTDYTTFEPYLEEYSYPSSQWLAPTQNCFENLQIWKTNASSGGTNDAFRPWAYSRLQGGGPLATIGVSGPPTTEQWQKPTYGASALGFFQHTLYGCLDYFAGVALDAVPYATYYGDNVMEELRKLADYAQDNGKIIWGETVPGTLDCQHIAPYIFSGDYNDRFVRRNRVLEQYRGTTDPAIYQWSSPGNGYLVKPSSHTQANVTENLNLENANVSVLTTGIITTIYSKWGNRQKLENAGITYFVS